jgi:hypothetical protein
MVDPLARITANRNGHPRLRPVNRRYFRFSPAGVGEFITDVAESDHGDLVSGTEPCGSGQRGAEILPFECREPFRNKGFHFIIGSFFAAMLISENLVGKTHLNTFHKTTNGLAMGFLAPIFFAGIGLEFNFSSIHNFGLLFAVLFVSYFSKIAGGYLGGRFAGLNNSIALTLGIGLNARGIMELVIANIAYKNGLINLEVFSILVIMGIVTTLSTPVADTLVSWTNVPSPSTSPAPIVKTTVKKPITKSPAKQPFRR